MKSTSIEELIQKYTDSITEGSFRMPTGYCRNCLRKPVSYKLHECRKRYFRFVVEDIVKVLISFLLRWKCPICKSTFTDYPPFIIPYKRFILADISRFSQAYLENEKVSYRDTIRHNGSDIGYENNSTGFCDRFLSHSTVWRFIIYMNKIHPASKDDVIPNYSICSTKYRSPKRKTILIRAVYSMKTMIKQFDLSNKYNFPGFETAAA